MAYVIDRQLEIKNIHSVRRHYGKLLVEIKDLDDKIYKYAWIKAGMATIDKNS